MASRAAYASEVKESESGWYWRVIAHGEELQVGFASGRTQAEQAAWAVIEQLTSAGSGRGRGVRMADQDTQKQGYEDGGRWGRIFTVREDANTQDKFELAMMFAGWAGISNPSSLTAYTRGFIDGISGHTNRAGSTLEAKLDKVIELAQQGRLPAATPSQ